MATLKAGINLRGEQGPNYLELGRPQPASGIALASKLAAGTELVKSLWIMCSLRLAHLAL